MQCFSASLTEATLNSFTIFLQHPYFNVIDFYFCQADIRDLSFLGGQISEGVKMGTIRVMVAKIVELIRDDTEDRFYFCSTPVWLGVTALLLIQKLIKV